MGVHVSRTGPAHPHRWFHLFGLIRGLFIECVWLTSVWSSFYFLHYTSLQRSSNFNLSRGLISSNKWKHLYRWAGPLNQPQMCLYNEHTDNKIASYPHPGAYLLVTFPANEVNYTSRQIWNQEVYLLCARMPSDTPRTGQPSLRSKLNCGYKTWQVVRAAFTSTAVEPFSLVKTKPSSALLVKAQ